MPNIDWPTLINWITVGFITFTFGAFGSYIIFQRQKTLDEKKEKVRSEREEEAKRKLELKKLQSQRLKDEELSAEIRFKLQGGEQPPRTVGEADRRTKREELLREITVTRVIFLLSIVTLTISVGATAKIIIELGQLVSPTPVQQFIFQVRVQDKNTVQDISGASVSFQSFGEIPITKITNNSGMANFTLDLSDIGKQVFIIVQALGYEKFEIDVTLNEGSFPFPILLDRIGSLTQTPHLVQHIAYVSEQEGGVPKVYIMEEDGSNQRLLITNLDSSCQPTWSPDGTQLLVVSPCDPRNEKVDIDYPGADIYIANISPDGVASQARLLISVTNGAYDPDWSSSGILFTGLGEGKPLVYFSDLQGNPQLLSSTLGTHQRLPKWIPGSENILFLRDFSQQLFVGPFADFTNPRVSNQQITHQTNRPLYPSFSPIGDVVAFTSEITTGEDDTINPSWHIFVLKWVWDVNNPEKQQNEESNRITKAGLYNIEPDWSPDGKTIAFTFYDHSIGSQFDIYTMTRSGGNLHPLTNTDKSNDPADPDEYQPVWRPSPASP